MKNIDSIECKSTNKMNQIGILQEFEHYLWRRFHLTPSGSGKNFTILPRVAPEVNNVQALQAYLKQIVRQR